MLWLSLCKIVRSPVILLLPLCNFVITLIYYDTIKRDGLVQSGHHNYCIECNMFVQIYSCKSDHVTLNNNRSHNYCIIYLNKWESCGKWVSNVVLASEILGHSACLIRTPEYSEQIHCSKGVRYRQVWNGLERTLPCFYDSLVRLSCRIRI